MKKILDNIVFKIVYNIIKWSFIVIVFLYIAFVAVQRLSGNKSIMGYRLFTVATGSMEGVYNINDVIIVKDCNTNDLKVGDDVAYMGKVDDLAGKLITHRIIDIQENEDGSRIFTTQGVNTDVQDPSITADQILGQVQGIMPVITQINHAVKSQVGFFLLVFVPLVLVIALEIAQTVVEMKIEKNELIEIKKQEENNEENKELQEQVPEVTEEEKDQEEIEII